VGQAPAGLTHLGSNARGYAEYRNQKDGKVLIALPRATFTMGSQHGYADEKPPHAVSVASFYIGKYEVTNAQYRRFVSASGHRSAGPWEKYASQWDESAPVVCVSWHDARAYCAWAGLRLPTEAEWEFAARGRDGREYPWGNAWDASRAVFSDNSGGRAQPVGSRPSGASAFGCLDMAGNVWEWCSSKYSPYPYNPNDGREDPGGSDVRVLRGGSWLDDAGGCRAAIRLDDLPGGFSGLWGFRPARTH